MCTITVRWCPATFSVSVVDPGGVAVPHPSARPGTGGSDDAEAVVVDVVEPEVPPPHEVRAAVAAHVVKRNAPGTGRRPERTSRRRAFVHALRIIDEPSQCRVLPHSAAVSDVSRHHDAPSQRALGSLSALGMT
jgi:hypothetical protein